MADIKQETVVRAQLASMLDRLPDLDLDTYEEPAAPRSDENAEEQSNNRWGFTFRRKVDSDAKPSIVIRPQGA